MRKLMLAAAGVVMLATTGIAVAHGIDDGRNVKSVAGTFTATTVSHSQTRSCTTTDGKTITSTYATYTGTASGDADLTGAATLQMRSTINSTDGFGVISGKLRIAASGGETGAQLTAVYDHGNIAGLAIGRAAASHTNLVANVSAGFSATAGFSGGKIGGGTAGGSAVEVGTTRCDAPKPVKPPVPDTSEAHGSISALSSSSITVGGLTCAIPSALAAKTNTLRVGGVAEIRCSVANGVNTLVRIDPRK
jgi:hypothetical protein